MRISVVGLGFVGLSLATVLSSKNYSVDGIEIDKEKCSMISNGKSPFFEPNLEKMLKSGLKKKLRISNDFSLIKNSDLIFVTVGTPQNVDGSIDLENYSTPMEAMGIAA